MCIHGPARAFEKIVDLAIEGTLNGFNTEMAAVLGASSYVRDYRTIRLNMGRRVGKTHYISTHCREHDLIVVHNDRAKYQFRDLRGVTVATPKELRWQNSYAIGRNRESALDLSKYHWIWIDEPRLCTAQAWTHRWLEEAKFSSDSLVIMLGE